MISTEATEAYNSRLTVDVSKLSELTAAQRDQVKQYGSQAEALLKNRDLAMFIHHYKFSLADALSEMGDHTDQANAERVAMSNSLAGITGFVNSLKRAVYYKNRLMTLDGQPPAQKSELKQVFDPNR